MDRLREMGLLDVGIDLGGRSQGMRHPSRRPREDDDSGPGEDGRCAGQGEDSPRYALARLPGTSRPRGLASRLRLGRWPLRPVWSFAPGSESLAAGSSAAEVERAGRLFLRGLLNGQPPVRRSVWTLLA